MAKATADSVVARRMLSVMLVALLSLCNSIQAVSNFTVWVTRRSTGDLYRLNSTTVHGYCDPSASYLINEKQCALDEELFNGMDAVYSTTSTIIVISDMHYNYNL